MGAMIEPRGTPALSVVLPVYNVGRYLRGAVEAVLAEGIPGAELILIEDGSSDDSAEIGRELAREYADRHLRFLQQPENGGVSRARNRGIREASGEYVAFVDSDDIVPPGGLRQMLQLAKRSAADIVAGNVESFVERDGERHYKRYWQLEEQGVFRYEMVGRLEALPRTVYAVSCWAKLFRRAFLDQHQIRFEDGIGFAEDQPFMIRAYTLADRIGICPDVVYHYRMDNADSAMRVCYRFERFVRIRDVVRTNLGLLTGWPRYYYARRALDYEILQNVRRIGLLSRAEASECFVVLREALMLCDEPTREEYVTENPQHRADYDDLMRGAFNRCWARHRVTGPTLSRVFRMAR